MRLVLLGTGGGPRPSSSRFPTSQAILAGERLMVVDCGNGVARQLAAAGLHARHLTDLFLTHHHVDHSADLGYLPLTAWIDGRSDRISIYGPPPTVDALESILNGYHEDVEKRGVSTGRPPFYPMLDVHEITNLGPVFEDVDVKVSCTQVNHPPFEMALAYKFEANGKSVVISGDTSPSKNLIELADGADILVHEVVHPVALDRLQETTNATTIVDHIRNSHTMVGDVGQIATKAGISRLVLSHLIPDNLSDDEWLAAVGNEFNGDVVVGRDLMEIDI